MSNGRLNRSEAMTFEQWRTLLEMFRSINNSMAIQNKLIIDFMEDLKQYRTEREKKEEVMDTTKKIDVELKRRFGWAYWILDKILPGLGLAVALAILHKIGLL